jgi:small multidrug resistance family-3 protein
VFVAMSMLWGWWIDGQRPDRWDIIGAALCVAGVSIIMYFPREGGRIGH